ncbi:dihydrofolate reductase [Flavobacterium amnicola]|uniref:Dihydrofolate reductase n=1 Tax=Flavobacterium amnicola TaxID=2506422 RepID=A0A4Q1K517_9FLAO|nr:dihydrofolate reductase [Flavobacterium amnicola]RXR20672.1 dihydrofolate reductase [Flavobacterium amnicola]
MSKNITLIAAAGQNNELGKDNDLLWHLPDDFKRFKAITTGHYIIMGRKTFESFPKPLPNRTHVIITRSETYSVPDGCIVVNSLKKAIDVCPERETVYIIGGGEIYKQSIDFADCIELTRVHNSFEADTFFPEIDLKEWEVTHSEFHDKDEKHLYSFTFETYRKKA